MQVLRKVQKVYNDVIEIYQSCLEPQPVTGSWAVETSSGHWSTQKTLADTHMDCRDTKCGFFLVTGCQGGLPRGTRQVQGAHSHAEGVIDPHSAFGNPYKSESNRPSSPRRPEKPTNWTNAWSGYYTSTVPPLQCKLVALPRLTANVRLEKHGDRWVRHKW